MRWVALGYHPKIQRPDPVLGSQMLGRVEYDHVRVPSAFFPGPSNLLISSGKSKKRTISRSPVKRHFEVASPPPASQQHRIVDDLGFSAVLNRQQSCKKSRRSARKRRAAPVFQGVLP